MSDKKRNQELIDWRLTTWDGAQRETLRRWRRLPLERVVAALEEMQQMAEELSESKSEKIFPLQDSSEG